MRRMMSAGSPWRTPAPSSSRATAGRRVTCSAVAADQREEGRQEGAARRSGASARSCRRTPEPRAARNAAPSRPVASHAAVVRHGCARRVADAGEAAGEARQQQTRRLDRDAASDRTDRCPLGPPAVCRLQHRIGGEEGREHDDVAEQEDPEAVGRRRRASTPVRASPCPVASIVGAAAACKGRPSPERGRFDRASCGCPRQSRRASHRRGARGLPDRCARPPRPEISSSVMSRQAKHDERRHRRRRGRATASHQICQIMREAQ